MQFGQQPSASFEKGVSNDFEVDTDHYFEKCISLCFGKARFVIVAEVFVVAQQAVQSARKSVKY